MTSLKVTKLDALFQNDSFDKKKGLKLYVILQVDPLKIKNCKRKV
jgi:hypothetical protein